MSFLFDAEKSEMKVCVCALAQNVDGAPATLQWHGRTTVSEHFPSDKFESTFMLR